MSSQNFTNFNLRSIPLTGDYLVGYSYDGSAELRTTVGSLVQGISSIINNNITPSFNPYSFNANTSAIQTTIGGNSALGQFSNVEGGYGNLASGLYSNVNGGTINVAGSAWATVGGGNLNQALSGYSVVAGGWSNCATNWASSVGGGYGNRALGSGTYVGGGLNNTASGTYSAILGGQNNTTNNLSGTFIVGTGLSAVSANYTYINNLELGNLPSSIILRDANNVRWKMFVTTSGTVSAVLA